MQSGKSRLPAAWRAVAQHFDRRDAMFFVGIALGAYGAWCIYPPAGFLVAGVVLVGVAIFGVRA
jgi:hypothetical protein